MRLQVSHIYSFPVGFWFSGDVKEDLNFPPFCIQTNDQQPSARLFLIKNAFQIRELHASAPVKNLDFWQQRFQSLRTGRGGDRSIAHTLDQSSPIATFHRKSWQIEL